MPSFKLSLRTNYIGKKLIHFPTLSSTNSYLLNEYEGPFQEGVVIVADHQTAGKGRLERSWFSIPDQSLLFSILLRPNAELKILPQLTQVCSLAVTKVLEKICSLSPRIKWPNDVLLNERKCCGILSQGKNVGATHISSISHEKKEFIVIGIGINVNERKEDFPDEIKDRATSLFIETGRKWNRESLFSNLLSEIELCYDRWKNGLFPELIEEIVLIFSLTGKEIEVVIDDNHTLTGKVQGLSSQGFLLIKDNKGKITQILSGDVNVISP